MDDRFKEIEEADMPTLLATLNELNEETMFLLISITNRDNKVVALIDTDSPLFQL